MKNENGIALLLVLWVITLLTVICAEFSWTMRTETTITRNFKEGEQAAYVAEAGINKAVVELTRSLNQPPKSSRPEEQEEQELPGWEPGQEPFTFTFGDYECELTIEDENNKININAFLQEAKKNPIKLKSLLEEKFGLEGEERDTVADSMIDWWDTDHDITGVNGAERDYYRSLDDPHDCRDGELPVIEDLLLIKGIDEQLYYGDAGSTEQATTLTPAELEGLLRDGAAASGAPQKQDLKNTETQEAEGFEKRNLGLVNMFTVYSSSKDFKIDINTASAEQLLLLEGMDAETARTIVRTRTERNFASPTDRLPEFKNYEIWKKDITLRSSAEAHFYKIKSSGFVGTVTRKITCTVLITRNNFFFMHWQEGS